MALQHGMAEARLIWLVDVYLLLQKHGVGFEWRDLVDSTRELGWKAALLTVLDEVIACFGYDLPDELQQGLQDVPARDQNVVSKSDLRMTRTELGLNRFASRKPEYKAKYLFRRLFPTPTHIRNHYLPDPEWLWPLYYPYRWFDIAFDFVKTMVKRVRVV